MDAELRKWRNRVTKKIQSKIEKYLELEGVPSSLLKVDFEEYDVLGRETNHTEESIASNLIGAYKKCQEHWNSKLVGQFLRSTLLETFERLDFDKTGAITPKILARELSILTGRNLRIRDVFRLCRRISPDDSINHELLCQVLKSR